MNAVDQPELSWLTEEGGWVTGYDQSGWPDSAWILHAMYSQLGDPNVTHDDRFRRQSPAGPESILGIDLGGSATVTGIPLGYERRPDPPAQRLRRLIAQ
jgi:hypothetical protein